MGANRNVLLQQYIKGQEVQGKVQEYAARPWAMAGSCIWKDLIVGRMAFELWQ